MRTLLLLTVLALALGLTTWAWWLAPEWMSPRDEPLAVQAATGESAPVQPPAPLARIATREREVQGSAKLLPPDLEEAQREPDVDLDASSSPSSPFESTPRELPTVNGPELVAHYPNGQMEYLGTQVETEPGVWVREGGWTAWHDNGVIDELGAYTNDAEDGLWEWWYPNGNRKAIGHWVEGQRIGAWKFWHENGALLSLAHYEDGQGHGPWTLFHENGLKWAEGSYSRGEISGPWTIWHEDGSINEERTGTYAQGQKVE